MWCEGLFLVRLSFDHDFICVGNRLPTKASVDRLPHIGVVVQAAEQVRGGGRGSIGGHPLHLSRPTFVRWQPDTNIVAATGFHAPEGRGAAVPGRRAQLERMFELRRYGPEKVASAILSAVRKDKAIRPVTPEAYLLYGTSRLLPQALRSTARGKVV